MAAATTEAGAAHLRSVTDRERGEAVTRRRERAGIMSLRQFKEEVGDLIGRAALTEVEEGTASERSFRKVERWLDDYEAELGIVNEPVARLIKTTMRGVTRSSIEEVIFEGPVDAVEQMKAMMRELINDTREGEET